ncbi:glycine/betaine ABC transporter [Acetobacter sp. AN02]|uniref:glycine betaine ABC transporter substrate-binding protein n=1 Tax=Acetobacter sp. AN02 TaxID=2894186 RepID=UPI002434149E|nr:glycine betaine ABC transporter substrate-binding protein [Acetobacter sp. AN02]MDG6094089.1 glycine/betaine ABC transporter [Acetobacter sp. AN02]
MNAGLSRQGGEFSVTYLTLAHPDTPLHAGVAAAVARVVEAHDMEPEYAAGPESSLRAMLSSGEADLFVTAWVKEGEKGDFIGTLYRPRFGLFVQDGSAVSSLTELAASGVNRALITPESVLPHVRSVVSACGLTEAGFTIEAEPDERAFARLEELAGQGEDIVFPLMMPGCLHHRLKLNLLQDPEGVTGSELEARIMIRPGLRDDADSDMLDELDEMLLSNKVVSALDDAIRYGGMTPDDAAEAWQRGRLVPR